VARSIVALAWRPRLGVNGGHREGSIRVGPLALRLIFRHAGASVTSRTARMSEDCSNSPAREESDSDRQARERLFASLYAELHRLADRELRRHPGVSVSPTTLVHEAYLNLSGREGAQFEDRGKFLGYLGRAMRGLVIDLVRRQQAEKRGAGFHITQLDTRVSDSVPQLDNLVQLSEALDELAAASERLAQVVDLRYFCGLSFEEIASLRGDSERTVKRDWEKARLLLQAALDEGEAAPG
jgi:RNA polymerase sigma factor (TIGR02999 family)